MPAKPAWLSRINDVILHLESLPRPFVDRPTVEFLLAVGPRRAQQIMAPCVSDHIGSSGLADRHALISHLRHLANGEDGVYELQRRRKVATLLAQLRQQRLEQPRLLVEAPLQVVSQEFTNLPAGVRLEPGRITVDFDQPQQALEKLLALAMAISNDFDRFVRLVQSAHG
jgi:hypothetical protein